MVGVANVETTDFTATVAGRIRGGDGAGVIADQPAAVTVVAAIFVAAAATAAVAGGVGVGYSTAVVADQPAAVAGVVAGACAVAVPGGVGVSDSAVVPADQPTAVAEDSIACAAAGGIGIGV